jgi:mRNA-degrading endonuclease toxin of MazEF toxin-antitoxin module
MIPLTTQLDALRFPGTVLVDADIQKGLRRPSVALVFQLTVVDQRALGARMGQVSEAVREDIWDALDRLTGRTDD